MRDEAYLSSEQIVNQDSGKSGTSELMGQQRSAEKWVKFCAHILVRRMFKSSDKVKAQKAIVVCSTNPFSVTKDLFPQLLAVLPRRQFSAPNPLWIIASTKESCLVQVYSLVKDFASNGRSLQACKETITSP